MAKHKPKEEHESAHEQHQEHHQKKSNFKFLKNYWMIASIVLAILLVVVLFTSSNGIGEKAAGEKVIAFVESRGGTAELISVESQSDLYQIVLSIDGQEFPVYLTKDGENLITTLIPMTGSAVDETPEQPEPQDLPKSDKPKVELFIMSHCPYGTQIEKGMIPVVNLLKDKIDFQLKFVYYAMHGETEVKEELNQYCIQKEQNSKFIDYLTCFLEDGDSERCLTETSIDKTKLKTCADAADAEFSVSSNLADKDSYLSEQFPLFDVNKADNEKYQVGGSPTLIINEQEASSARDSAALLAVICSAFNTAPEECSEELSSTAPSSGFGWAGSSSSGGSCG